jgi:hypothetical protein
MKRVPIYSRVIIREQNAGLTVKDKEYYLECNKAEESD